jgi:hypothetical protein
MNGFLAALIFVVAAWGADAGADGGAEGSPPPLTPTGGDDDARAELDAAIQLYLQGAPQQARARLQAVLARGPALPTSVRADALAYLGDILYSEQGPEASRSVFQALLREAPEYRLDPFAHPAVVCGWLETVRADLRAAALPRAPLPPARPPFPALALLPGGVHAFAAGRTVEGATLATLQATGLVVSIVTRASIDRAFQEQPDDKEAVVRTIGWNRASVALGWSAWALPLAVETVRWQRAGVQTPKGSVSATVSPTGVALRGTF